MKHIVTFIISCLLLAFSWSCAQDDFAGDGNAPGNGQMTVRFNVTRLSGSIDTRGISTRAAIPAETGEEMVQSLFLMFFDPADGLKYKGYSEVTGATLAMNANHTITLPAGLTAANSYEILAVANLAQGSYLGDKNNVEEWMAQWTGLSLAAVKLKALALVEGSPSGNDRRIHPDELLMNGSATKAAGASDLTLTLTRNLSRFDVQNMVKAGYNLVSASVWNAYPSSSVFGGGITDYSASAPRIRRFYGIDNDAPYNNIIGGLYAFENKSAEPAQGDKVTTCLIIGLEEISSGALKYYRANINNKEGIQDLVRNDAYRINIEGVVAGSGADTEEEAFTGLKNTLIYTINDWNRDDNGLFISDEYSLLGLPVKKISIGSKEANLSYSIYTSTSLTSYEPLAIKNQTWDFDNSDDKIKASLIGNTLTINAKNMEAGEADRQGVITISFAGLEGAITVIQSASVDKYLTVTFGEMTTTTLGAAAGIGTGAIEVKASGNWTAKLYGDNGFTFASGGAPVSTIASSGSDYIVNGRFFQIYTYSANPGLARKAFAIITLDEDPDNYSAVVTVTQKIPGILEVTPASVLFDHNGDVASGHTNRINIKAYDSDGNLRPTWHYTLTGAHADRFDIRNETRSATDVNGNYFEVVARGKNLTDITCNATITITCDGVSKTVALTQTPDRYSLSLEDEQPVPVTGGAKKVTLFDNNSKWAIVSIITSGTGSRSLENHDAFLTVDGTPILVGQKMDATTTSFNVVFKKVYFPNREIDNIQAKVVVGRFQDGADTPFDTETIIVKQDKLTSKGVHIWNANVGYGALESRADFNIMQYSNALKELGYTWTTNISTKPPVVTYLHMSNYALNGNFNWTPHNYFRTGTDGITMICGDAIGNVTALQNYFGPLGYTVEAGSGNTHARLDANLLVSGNRIGLFLTEYGAISIPSVNTAFYVDGVHTRITGWPSTATPILRSGSNVIMAIDPANRVVYLGESQIFYYGSEMSGNRREFMNNYIQYVINAAKYGSHFTDMLRKSNDVTGFVAPEAPWDSVWGANAWPGHRN